VRRSCELGGCGLMAYVAGILSKMDQERDQEFQICCSNSDIKAMYLC